MNLLFKKIIFICKFLITISEYAFLYIVGILSSKKKNIIFIPQNWSIGGTKKFTQHFLDYAKKKEFNVIVLLPEHEVDLFKHEYSNLLYKDICTINKEFWEHKTLWYSTKHSLFKYFLYGSICQSLSLLKLIIKTKTA